jgi:hypothetical protein
MSSWTVFFVAVPQVHCVYELRLRYVSAHAWDCLIYVSGSLQASFSGDGETSANEFLGRIFHATGASDVVAAGD